MYIAATKPKFLAFYHRGHVRVAAQKFTMRHFGSEKHKSIHITNGTRTRRSSNYDERTDKIGRVKTKMPFEEFMAYYDRSFNENTVRRVERLRS